MDRKRKDKKVSNTDWASPSDAEAGRTRRPGATEPFPQRAAKVLIPPMTAEDLYAPPGTLGPSNRGEGGCGKSPWRSARRPVTSCASSRKAFGRLFPPVLAQ